MASFPRFSLLVIFLVTAFSSSVLIEGARENKMFSKVTHYGLKNSVVFVGTAKNNVGEAKIPAVELEATAEAPAPGTSVSTESEHEKYYGPYGHETGLLPPEKGTTGTKDEEDLVAEELAGGNNNNNYNNNLNGYMLAGENYVSGNHQYSNNNNNGYESERQGMSDTRFMEGGKYYYDVSSEKNAYSSNGYEQERVTSNYGNGGYYGNTKNQKYVFDSMEEYEQYVENQHYVP